MQMRVMGPKQMLEEILGPELCEKVTVQGGDTTITLDKNGPMDQAACNDAFDRLVSANFMAYDTAKEERIKKFNPEAEEVIFAPPMAGG